MHKLNNEIKQEILTTREGNNTKSPWQGFLVTKYAGIKLFGLIKNDIHLKFN